MTKLKTIGKLNVCAYCGTVFSPVAKRSIDHVLPKSKGGSNSTDNLIDACVRCNSLKADMSLHQFIDFCLKKSRKLRDKAADYDRIILGATRLIQDKEYICYRNKNNEPDGIDRPQQGEISNYEAVGPDPNNQHNYT